MFKEPVHVKVSDPAALLSAVPHLVGFNPASSLVVIGVAGPRNQVIVTLRYDMPAEQDVIHGVVAEVGHAMTVLAGQEITTLAAVIYGTAEAGAPVATALLAAAETAGIRVIDVLRVTDGRYWSYVCQDAECCSPLGTPVEAVAMPELDALPVVADRQAKAQMVAPVTDQEAVRMRQATDRAWKAFTEAAFNTDRKQVVAGWLDASQAAIASYRNGVTSPLPDDYAAALILSMMDLRVRDDAWARMDPEYRQAHQQLWTDLTRRAPTQYVAPVASLLAYVAWQEGDGALANVALDRALAADPEYMMALLLRDIISAGVPPNMARLPMTPEEVAQSYAEQGN
jgi:hypothetical protein